MPRCCADAAIGVTANATAVVMAVSFDIFLHGADAEQHGGLRDWRRAGYGLCPTKPLNAACLGHPVRIAEFDA